MTRRTLPHESIREPESKLKKAELETERIYLRSAPRLAHWCFVPKRLRRFEQLFDRKSVIVRAMLKQMVVPGFSLEQRWNLTSGHPPERHRRSIHWNKPLEPPPKIRAVTAVIREMLERIDAFPNRVIDQSIGGERVLGIGRASARVVLQSPDEPRRGLRDNVDWLEHQDEFAHARIGQRVT